MKFPNIIANSNEEYITLPALKTFVKSKAITVSKEAETSRNKAAYIAAISEYADKAPDNHKEVIEWIDAVIKEGIKDVQISHVTLSSEGEILFANEARAQKRLNECVSTSMPHLAGNTYNNNYSLVKAEVSRDSHGKVISLLFCRMLKYYDAKKATGAIVEYPVFVDYYYEQGWLIVRYKPRSSLYDILPEGTPLEEMLKHSLTVNKEIEKVYKHIFDILPLNQMDAESASKIMQNKFFQILDRYTHTPSEIVQVLEDNEAGIEQIVTALMQTCSLPVSYQNKVETDIKNLAEKFLSITWPDKDIFIKDREAYPTRLSATDEENSRIDQTAATLDDPLQSKEVFFDNKRMLCDQKSCEGLTLVWKRKDRTYYEPSFPVRLSEKGGICTLSFKKYVVEEDIQHVLFAIVTA